MKDFSDMVYTFTDEEMKSYEYEIRVKTAEEFAQKLCSDWCVDMLAAHDDVKGIRNIIYNELQNMK